MPYSPQAKVTTGSQTLVHFNILTMLLLPASSSSICSDTVITSACGKLTLASSAILRLVRLVIWVYGLTPGDDRKTVTLKFVVGVMIAEQATIFDQSSVLPNVVQLYKRASIQDKQCKRELTNMKTLQLMHEINNDYN